MVDIFHNPNKDSYYRNPTFYYIGTLDPLGLRKPSTLRSTWNHPRRGACDSCDAMRGIRHHRMNYPEIASPLCSAILLVRIKNSKLSTLYTAT